MSPIQRLVSPKLPTVLSTQTHVELTGYDLWFNNIDNVHTLPAQVDVPRFEEALSKALQWYPHAAGQLRRASGGRWSIELTNTAIPLDVDYKLNMSADMLLEGDWVVQSDITPFLNPQPLGANLVNGGAPLLRLKLTFFENETCIGVSWNHTLGDAITLLRFTNALSQFYQGLSPEHPVPTFKKYHFPSPSSSVLAEFWSLMPHLHDSRLFSELGSAFAEVHKNIEQLRWRIDVDDLATLCLTLSSEGKDEYISKQDCLSAYLVSVLNHNTDTPVQTVVNTSNYRNVCAPFVDKDMASNPIQCAFASVPTDMPGIAVALRRALVRSREPDYICNWMAVASNHMLQTTNAGRSFLFGYNARMVVVNSNIGIDWCGAHFGYPDSSRFYTTGMIKHYLRCFRSNPTKGDNGEWRAHRSIEIAMGVVAKLKPKLLETLGRGVSYPLNNEHMQL